MVITTILNAVLVLGVIVMVLTPLVWAILTQHRDHPDAAATHGGATSQAPRHPRRHAPQLRHPAIGRV